MAEKKGTEIKSTRKSEVKVAPKILDNKRGEKGTEIIDRNPKSAP